MSKPNPFKWFKTSPEIIRLAVMLYVRFPLSLRNVEDLLHERGVEISDETVRFWWHRFGPMFAAEIRKRRIEGMRTSSWKRHLDEMFVKINGERRYLWRAVDHEGEVLESFVTKARDKKAALKFLKKAMKKHGRAGLFVTDKLRSYGAAMKELGLLDRQATGRWLNNRAENSHLPFRRRERAMLRFRRVRSLQKFASVHASVTNHFNIERSLSSRPLCKANRAAAGLAEWRGLAPIAPITRRWSRSRCSLRAAWNAEPWRRKTSATSRPPAMTAARQAGGTTSSLSFSSGLSVRPMSPCETWV
jgi:putative transposase